MGMALQLPIHSLEAMRELFEEVFNDALVVVAPAKDVIERGKTVSLAGLFLVIKLLRVELMTAHYTPVVARCVHRKTGSQCSINTNNHRVLSSSTVPGEVIALHKLNH